VIHTFIAPMLQEPEQNKSSVLNMCLVRCYLSRTSDHLFIQYHSLELVWQCSVTSAESHITRSTLLAPSFFILLVEKVWQYSQVGWNSQCSL